MTQEVVGYLDNMPGGCGVNIFTDFKLKSKEKKKPHKKRSYLDYWNDDGQHDGKSPISKFKNDEFNTGYVVAAFINTPDCEAAYKDLSNHLKLIWQSDVRINKAHNSNFFFAVFDKGQK